MDKYIVYDGNFNIQGIGKSYEEACEIAKDCIYKDLINIMIKCRSKYGVLFVVYNGVIKCIYTLPPFFSIYEPEIQRLEYNDELVIDMILHSRFKEQYLEQIQEEVK